MIYVDEQLRLKLEILDKILSSIDIESLKQFSESEEIVAKLKGSNAEVHTIMSIIEQHNRMTVELSSLRNDLQMLKSDFQNLLQVVVKPYESHIPSTVTNLKNRYYVY